MHLKQLSPCNYVNLSTIFSWNYRVVFAILCSLSVVLWTQVFTHLQDTAYLDSPAGVLPRTSHEAKCRFSAPPTDFFRRYSRVFVVGRFDDENAISATRRLLEGGAAVTFLAVTTSGVGESRITSLQGFCGEKTANRGHLGLLTLVQCRKSPDLLPRILREAQPEVILVTYDPALEVKIEPVRNVEFFESYIDVLQQMSLDRALNAVPVYVYVAGAEDGVLPACDRSRNYVHLDTVLVKQMELYSTVYRNLHQQDLHLVDHLV